jgi:hypothetical protein
MEDEGEYEVYLKMINIIWWVKIWCNRINKMYKVRYNYL